MPTAMASDRDLGFEQIDAAIHYGALLIRAVAYAFVYAVADLYDCGRALLTGIWLGDVAGHLLELVWLRRDAWLQAVSELLLLGVVWLFIRSQLVWPVELPLRAILGLAAFGVFASRLGGTWFTVLGANHRGFA